MNTVFVGCGAISAEWFDVLKARDEIHMTGLVDRTREKADRINEKYGWSARFYTDYREALEALNPDLVMIATRPDSHYNIASFALNQGCHVFMEKPLAETMEQGLALRRLSRETEKALFIIQNRRYLSKLQGFHDLLAAGPGDHIGELSTLQADFFVEPHFGGFREEMEHPLILDMSIHTFDQARFITGCDPVSVYCEEYNTKGSWYRGNASASCLFEMTDGVRFIYNGSWSARGKLTSWQSEWRAMASRGAAFWDGESDPWYELKSPKEEGHAFPVKYDRTVSSSPVIDEEHLGCLNDMINALVAGRPAPTAVEDNIMSFAMVIGAIRSAEIGRRISITEIMNEEI